MDRRKILSVVLSFVVVSLSALSVQAKGNVLVIGATPVPHAEILR